MPRLRRTSQNDPGWTRRRAGKGFVYLDEHGEPLGSCGPIPARTSAPPLSSGRCSSCCARADAARLGFRRGRHVGDDGVMVSSARVRWRARAQPSRRCSRPPAWPGATPAPLSPPSPRPGRRPRVGVRTRPTRRPRRRPSGSVSPRDGDRPPPSSTAPLGSRAGCRCRSWPGQVIVADYSGTAAPVDLVRRLHLAGVIAFADNVSSAQQVRAANLRLRRELRRPLVVSVDQEGGIVERVRDGLTRFPAFMSAGAADDPALTTSTYAAVGCRAGPGRLHDGLRSGRRRHVGAGRPDDRLALGRLAARCGGRARGGRRAGASRRRHRPGGQALPRSRVGARRQPRDPARAEAVAA